MSETETKPRISPRRLRAQSLVNAVLQPDITYKQVAEQLGIKAANPTQTVYNRLARKAPQAEMHRVAIDQEAEREKHLRLAMELHDKAKKDKSWNSATGALSLATQIAGTRAPEQVITTNKPVSVNDLAKLNRAEKDALLAELLFGGTVSGEDAAQGDEFSDSLDVWAMV